MKPNLCNRSSCLVRQNAYTALPRLVRHTTLCNFILLKLFIEETFRKIGTFCILNVKNRTQCGIIK